MYIKNRARAKKFCSAKCVINVVRYYSSVYSLCQAAFTFRGITGNQTVFCKPFQSRSTLLANFSYISGAFTGVFLPLCQVRNPP